MRLVFSKPAASTPPPPLAAVTGRGQGSQLAVHRFLACARKRAHALQPPCFKSSLAPVRANPDGAGGRPRADAPVARRFGTLPGARGGGSASVSCGVRRRSSRVLDPPAQLTVYRGRWPVGIQRGDSKDLGVYRKPSFNGER